MAPHGSAARATRRRRRAGVRARRGRRGRQPAAALAGDAGAGLLPLRGAPAAAAVAGSTLTAAGSLPRSGMPNASDGPGLALGARDVHIRYAAIGAPAGAERRESLLALLAPEERQRLARLAFDRDRWQYLVAHALLRRTLSSVAPVAPAAWRFRDAGRGRPEIASPAAGARLRFSLSHTAGLAACAVCLDHDVGVDAEAIDETLIPASLAPRLLAPAEQEALAALAPEARARRLFELWTLKEALLKATGEGLARPLDRLSFRLAPGEPPCLLAGGDGGLAPADWCFHIVPLATRHALAAAVRAPGGRAVRFTARAVGSD